MCAASTILSAPTILASRTQKRPFLSGGRRCLTTTTKLGEIQKGFFFPLIEKHLSYANADSVLQLAVDILNACLRMFLMSFEVSNSLKPFWLQF